MTTFKAKRLGLASGNLSVVVMDDDDAFARGIRHGDRVRVCRVTPSGEPEGQGVTAIVDIATGTGIVERGVLGFYDEIVDRLGLGADGTRVAIQAISKPRSFAAIKAKIRGKTLTTREIQDIISDCNAGNLLPIEIAAFVTGLEVRGATDDEIVDLCLAMAHSGEILDFGPEVYDKHSTGGVPGNKVTLVIVPVAAAAGLFIPKTSTRAITSPSGTADSMEVLAPVTFAKEKVVELLQKNRAGIFWGGAMKSAPADDVLLNVEKPLAMDPVPLMIASILCKKLAMGVKKLVMDIPCGKGTKFPTVEDGRKYAMKFKDVARRVGIEATCLLTSAQQPIGHAVGPALEAREALWLLKDPKGSKASSSLKSKSCELAGILLEMAGKAPEGKGKDAAVELLESGRAYEAMRAIIENQGGDPDVDPEEIEVGPLVAELEATVDGHVSAVENEHVNAIAKIAGCPGSKRAGVEVVQKIGALVKKGDVMLRVFSESESKLKEAVEYYNAHRPHVLGGMTIEKI
ncbi:MAG: thymidine phosphorylase [Promethearchaeota archaeon]